MSSFLQRLRKSSGVAALVALVLAVLSIPLWLPPGVSGATVESRLYDGLLGTRRLLEEWGAEVELIKVGATAASPTASEEGDTPDETLDPQRLEERVALVAFPIQRTLLGAEAVLESWVRDGGKLVLTYSGTLLALEEDEFLAGFSVEMEKSLGPNSLSPFRWWRQKRAGESHRLEIQSSSGSHAGVSELVTDRVVALPTKGAGCDAIARRTGAFDTRDVAKEPGNAAGVHATVLRCVLGEGEVWLAPTSAFSNARLANAGNLDLLWHLRQRLGSRWTVLEGTSEILLSAVAEERAKNTRATLNLMALQLGLLYLGSVLALAWGFGPRWAERKLPPEGHRSFLLGLGALHQKLGGLGDAAGLLHQRWLDYDPLARRRSLNAPQIETMSEDELVEFAGNYSRRPMAQQNKQKQVEI